MASTMNKSATLNSPTITKPFILKERHQQKKQKVQSLYSISYVYLHSMVLHTMQVSWGSEVTLMNPKNSKTAQVYVFSSDTISENCIEMDEAIRKELSADYGMCIYVTARLQNKVINFSEINQNQSTSIQPVFSEMTYAYDKTESYELISKIMGNKLKIQMKSLKYGECPKIYYLETSRPIQNYPITTILDYLQHQQNYQVYPQRGVIQIITQDAHSINIQLRELIKPMTIDTQIIMNLINNLYKIPQRNMRSELQSISDSPKIVGQSQDNELFVSKKPSTSYQNTYCQTFGKQTVAGDSDYQNLMDQPKITKVNTEFRTEASLPKNPIVQHHNTDFKKLQEKVDRIAEQVQQMMAKLTAKSSDGKKDSAQISIQDRLDRQNSEGNESCCIEMQNGETWTPNLDMANQPFRIFQRQKTGGRKLSIVQQNSSVYELQSSLKIQQPELIEQTDPNQNNAEPETFKIQRILTKIQKNYHFKITHQQQSQWLAITPLNIPQFQQDYVFRHKIKVTNSKNNFIFYGLVDRSKISEKSYWKREGSVGCFLYSSKVYYNGEQLPKSQTLNKGKYQTLAKNGQTVQIRTNRVFKEISWFVDGYKKLHYKFPLFFSRYDEQKDLVPFVQLFEEGDCIEFISEAF